MTGILGGERWTAIAERQAAPTPGEVAFLLGLSDERDRWLRSALSAWHAGFAAGELAHADDHAKGFVAGAAAIKRQIRNEVDDWVIEVQRRHVCCRECRRGISGKRLCDRYRGCPRCEIRTRETFGLVHPDDYPGEPHDQRAAG